MAQNVSRMLDKTAISTFILVVIYTGSFNLYLYELFYGDWFVTQTRSFFYLSTIVTIVWLTIDDMRGHNTILQKQSNILCKFCIVIDFIIIYLSLNDILKNPIIYFIVFNSMVFVLTLLILIIGGKYGYFKKYNA